MPETETDNKAEAFKKWIGSWSGCDGGDPKADIWVCGIEWGGGEDYELLREEIPKGEVTKPEYNLRDKCNYRYAQNLAKLYAAIKGRKVDEYKDVANKCTGTEFCMLNLYPIAFRNTSETWWKEYGLPEITGIESKYLYRAFCYAHRFPFFAKQVKEQEHKPKLVIGVGASCLIEFLLFFSVSGECSGLSGFIKSGEIASGSETNNKPRSYYWADLYGGATKFVVVPHFSGAYGLNSDDLIQEMGQRIYELVPSIRDKSTPSQ